MYLKVYSYVTDNSFVIIIIRGVFIATIVQCPSIEGVHVYLQCPLRYCS